MFDSNSLQLYKTHGKEMQNAKNYMLLLEPVLDRKIGYFQIVN